MPPRFPCAPACRLRVDVGSDAVSHYKPTGACGTRNGGREGRSDSRCESGSWSVTGTGRGRGSSAGFGNHSRGTRSTIRPLSRIALVLAVCVACTPPHGARGQDSPAPLPISVVGAVASNWTVEPAAASDWIIASDSSAPPAAMDSNTTDTVDTNPLTLTLGSVLASNMVLQRSPVNPTRSSIFQNVICPTIFPKSGLKILSPYDSDTLKPKT